MKKALASILAAMMILGIGAAGARAEEEPAAEETKSVEAPPGMEELKLVLPRPMFQGTPTNIVTENLDPRTGRMRPPFFVPEGSTNVALGKPVTSSDPWPIIGELDMVTDGDKSGIDGTYIELGPGPQWVQIDLGRPYALHAIVVWHFHASARVYRDVVVRVGNDPEFKEGVKIVYNNDHDNTSGFGKGKDHEWIETNEGRLIDPKGVVARYVRLHSNGNTATDQNNYVEVEVYATPPKENPAEES